MYVAKLRIRNFRCFEETECELNYPGRAATEDRPVPSRLGNVNLFLGDNGSGKSSAFQALALAVLAPIIRASGFRAEYLVRRVPGDVSWATANGTNSRDQDDNPIRARARVSAYMKLDATDGPYGSEKSDGVNEHAATIRRKGDIEEITDIVGSKHTINRIFSDDYLSFFLAGYGANRRTERPEAYNETLRSPRYQRVAGLFEEHAGLFPFSVGYLQLEKRGFLDEARAILNALLPDDVNLTDRTDGQQRLLFDRDGVLLPFSALADGYRAFVGWVWDLLVQIARLRTPDGSRLNLREVAGVVIVDEIDLFLHPEWQRLVIDQVARTFPRLQFLFSSHSPLVAGTLEPENIIVLDKYTLKRYRESIYGLTPNQILTSSYFGLRSTRAPGTGTLSDAAKRALGREDAKTNGEEADPNDRTFDPEERVRRMLEEIRKA